MNNESLVSKLLAEVRRDQPTDMQCYLDRSATAKRLRVKEPSDLLLELLDHLSSLPPEGGIDDLGREALLTLVVMQAGIDEFDCCLTAQSSLEECRAWLESHLAVEAA